MSEKQANIANAKRQTHNIQDGYAILPHTYSSRPQFLHATHPVGLLLFASPAGSLKTISLSLVGNFVSGVRLLPLNNAKVK